MTSHSTGLFHLFCFCLYQVVVHSKKCPTTWPCISLQTTWKYQNTVEIFASDSSPFRIPLSPELSIRAMTNGMSHNFQKSMPLLIPKKNKTFLPNDFQIFFLIFLSEGCYTRISIILKMKLADNGSFVVVLILWKQRCHQKRLFMEQSSIWKIGWAEEQTGELGKHLTFLVHSLKTRRHTLITLGEKIEINTKILGFNNSLDSLSLQLFQLTKCKRKNSYSNI